MIKKFTLLIVLVIGTTISAAAADKVIFKSTGTKEGKNPLYLTGNLTKPEGKGPFPAIVMLHGASGMHYGMDIWAERFSKWGYISLQVDSFTPRGETSIFNDMLKIPPWVRAQDAHDAKAYLSELNVVDPDRIGVMGWSHGGWTTLHALDATDPPRKNPFKAAIAFYPYCGVDLEYMDAPLLILIGELDRLCPAVLCKNSMPSVKTKHEIALKVYPGEHHVFELKKSEAAADASIQVKKFLDKHM
ncbi:MAG: dienelactone hydrolase family protein [Deltaproteobacteria bacterium]|nr:dienelactone hydrolase family protein [Deltaproteobacteria bacterium]MBW1848631.1 dienelactone hydrolase family protein [Deltaproteobacteria bacterium]MBW2181858.1 dienelactone hydrolase family protein [Deltaproteobacteria bacterium]